MAGPTLLLVLVPPDGLGLRPGALQTSHRPGWLARAHQIGLLVLPRVEDARDRLAPGASSRAAGACPGHRAQRPGQAQIGQGAGSLLLLDSIPAPARRSATLRRLLLTSSSIPPLHGPASAPRRAVALL